VIFSGWKVDGALLEIILEISCVVGLYWACHFLVSAAAGVHGPNGDHNWVDIPGFMYSCWRVFVHNLHADFPGLGWVGHLNKEVLSLNKLGVCFPVVMLVSRSLVLV